MEYSTENGLYDWNKTRSAETFLLYILTMIIDIFTFKKTLYHHNSIHIITIYYYYQFSTTNQIKTKENIQNFVTI